jgi:hypothetical protein
MTTIHSLFKLHRTSNAFEVASLLGTSGYGCCFNRRLEEFHGVNTGHDGGHGQNSANPASQKSSESDQN